MIEAVLDFIFPPHCPVCGAYTAKRGRWCPTCLSEVLQPQRLPLTVPMQVFIERAWALSVYRGGTRDLIRRLKYRGQRSCLPYIRTMLEQAQENPAVPELLAAVDVAVPVPLHPKKEKQRGFNQSALIFRDWLQSQGIPMLRGLERVRETRPMYRLSAEERQHNLAGAFQAVAGADLVGKRVLLVDDILTTGATLYACARELKRNGAASTAALVLASDHHGISL